MFKNYLIIAYYNKSITSSFTAEIKQIFQLINFHFRDTLRYVSSLKISNGKQGFPKLNEVSGKYPTIYKNKLYSGVRFFINFYFR